MRKLIYVALLLAILAGLARLSLELPQVQQAILQPAAERLMQGAVAGIPQPEALSAYICGRSSPIPAPGTAQACIAIMTPEHLYLVDVGAGATEWLAQARLPMERLQAIFVTHFHSDHIAELYEVNLNSWVAGRPAPLQVHGPLGVEQVVAGTNDAYQLDVGYRVAHHGEALLPPALGKLQAQRLRPGVVLEDGAMKVTAFVADHGPVSPSVGYRFDYQGRSIFVSGDGLVTEQTMQAAEGLDLMLHDALSLPIITALSDAAYAAGFDRRGKILSDVTNYHASTDSIAELIASADIGLVALYHLVPVPQNLLLERIFMRGLPRDVVLAEEGQWFTLPANSTEIIHR